MLARQAAAEVHSTLNSLMRTRSPVLGLGGPPLARRAPPGPRTKLRALRELGQDVSEAMVPIAITGDIRPNSSIARISPGVGSLIKRKGLA
jgi:hypothetical protein